MKRLMMLAGMMALAVHAAPPEKLDPVAEGFPVWTGLSAKNFLCGRELTPSDLRHKVTIIVEIEPNDKLPQQLISASDLLSKSSTASAGGHGSNWEDAELARGVIGAVSVRNASPKFAEKLSQILANKGEKPLPKDDATVVTRLNGNGCSFYRDLSFQGAPEVTTEKRPYVYVFGPSGSEPLCHGPLATVKKDALAAIAKGRKEINEWDQKWRPFYGNVAEPKFNTALAKTLEKGKKAKVAPIDAVAKALLSDVKSKDPEKAKEAQILYDAINQTRSDLILRIELEASACPHRAYYDILTLQKYWPMDKKRVEAAMLKMKANPAVDMMGKIFVRLMELADPSFTCKNAGEAKKIDLELKKMKKNLAASKESTNITVQNGALLLDMRIDDLIQQMPNRIATK